MHIKIQTTDLKLTREIDEYIRKRIGTISRFLGSDDAAAMAEVEVGRITYHHKRGEVFKAEVNLGMPGKQFRATAEAEDLYTAIDEVREELERGVVSAKGKERTLFRRGAAMLKDVVKGLDRFKWKKFPKLPKFPRWRK
ncbi:MAG: ribosome-associated translation inhibitor RaiA [bacterium]|nr:ribosome-associated translation inhibitor RaiA [bacterium]